jgi:hypothetical protein
VWENSAAAWRVSTLDVDFDEDNADVRRLHTHPEGRPAMSSIQHIPFARRSQRPHQRLQAVVILALGLACARAGAAAPGTPMATPSIEPSVSAPGGKLNWVAPMGGRFSDGANWEQGHAPDSNFDVVFAPPGNLTTLADTSATVNSLTVGGAAGSAPATLQLSNGAVITTLDLHIGGTLIQSSGVLSGQGSIINGLLNYGTVRATPGNTLTSNYALDNRGLVTGTGRIDANLVNRGGNVGVQVFAGEVLTIGGVSNTNANKSVIRVSGGQLNFDGSLQNENLSTVQLSSATMRARSLVNNGLLGLDGGAAHVAGQLANNASGTVDIAAGTRADFTGRFLHSGNVSVGAGGQFSMLGYTTGGGSFETADTAARLHFGAEYSPLLAGHTVQIGNADFASRLSLLLGGHDAGITHDKISFNGSVEFIGGSVLGLHLTAGFVPTQGDAFDLFDFAQAPVGSFSGFELPSLAAGLAWDTSDIYTEGMLRVSAVPEPHTWALMLAGLVLTTRLARRRGLRD